jgi:hypothetical protein
VPIVESSVPDPSDPDPHVFGPPCLDPLVRGMDPDPDPSIIKQGRKTLISTVL